MRLDEYARCDGIDLIDLMKKAEIASTELTDLAHLAIDQLNPALNCVVHRIDDASPPCDSFQTGPFWGVPFLMKEGTAAIAGEPWNMASRLGVGRIAKADDELTLRFRKAGVTIIGQSTVPEACNAPTTESVLHGPTRNPWNTQYMAGGSSGGAAAAVAAGIVPMAHAGDGAGSIRIPAACCGLVGLKPTRARTPTHQGAIFALTASHVLSRTVRDSALMLDCIQGPELGALFIAPPPERPYFMEVTLEPKPLKVAFTTRSPAGTTVDPECVEWVHKAANACTMLGHHVEETVFEYDWNALLEAFIDLYSYRHPLDIENLERATGRHVGPETRETCNLAMLAHAQRLSMLDFARHIDALAVICRRAAEFFAHYDVLFSPVTNRPALPVGEMNANAPDLTAALWFERQFTHYAAFTAIYNATGQPAISLPLGHSRSDLPIGVQIAAKHGDEATLFRLCAQLEGALPWRDRRPPISIF